MQRVEIWIALALLLAVGSARADDFDLDWDALREDWVVELLTADEDGDLRETSVWVVVVGDAAYVRTNDSAWLENIRRGSAVRLRVREVETSMHRVEVADAALKARVEEAFKAKYGTLQRVMSALRLSDPTVLELTPKS